jgi:site-specific recombinase XerD
LTLSAARPIIPSFKGEAMTLGKLGRECLTYLVGARGYSVQTGRNYEYAFDQFRAYLRAAGRPDTLREFTPANLMGFVTDLAGRGVSPNSIVVKLSALSSLAQYAMKRTDEDGDPLLATNPTKAFDWPQTQATETAFLHPDELARFLAVALSLQEGAARDLLMDTGSRVSELCRANVGDLRQIAEAWTLSVIVKGRGTRRRPIDMPIRDATARLLIEAQMARGIPSSDPKRDAGQPLLVNRHGQRLTTGQMKYLMVKIARLAGIDRFRLSPHKIRHTVNVVRKVSGIDPYIRSRLLGQSSPRSQDRYEHVGPGELEDAKAKEAAGLDAYLAKQRRVKD